MDVLQQCAKSFRTLLDTGYEIVVGRKGKIVHLDITFEASDFHHLAGLHKLKDIESVSGKREDIFNSIIVGNIQLSDIKKSVFFNSIVNRILLLMDLENILDDNRMVFKYNGRENPFSVIRAEYLLSTDFKNNNIYIFLDKRDETDQYFCRSFFPKERIDYTKGQAAYTLLFKKKYIISTGESAIQYNRLRL